MPPLPHSSPLQLLHALRGLQPLAALGLQERGFVGTLLQSLLRGQDPDRHAMAANLCLLALQQHPFDPLWSALLLDLHRAAPFLPPQTAALARALAQTMAKPDPVEGYDDLLASDEHEAVLKHLPALVADPAEGLYRLGRSWDWLLRLGRAAEPRILAERTAMAPEAEPLRARLLAQWALYYDNPQGALERVQALDPALWNPWRDLVAAELELRLDQDGTDRLRALWPSLGWHPHLVLMLHDRLFPPPGSAPDSELERTAVLLYSWNKAELLAQTLDSLAASDIGPARVAVLDNGSDQGNGDPMGRTLEHARELFGQRCATVRLPVNVGAPAARNWLLSLPELADAQHLAFLDDDVLVPGNWLRRLLAQALSLINEGGGYGAIGCRIMSATAPDCLQSADYHLMPVQPDQSTFQDRPDLLAVFDNTASALDMGMFRYSRPAGSVSGCCHLLSRKGVDQAGGFNLAFTPTQFDDLERDLRLGLTGLPVHYCGDLAVRHVQHSSLAKAKSPVQMAQVMGNKIKLEGMFDQEQVERLLREDLERLWADLITKAQRIQKVLS